MAQQINTNRSNEEFQCPIGIGSFQAKSVAECFLYQLPYFLDEIKMGYICIFFCVLIIIISIFGKVKDSYKWFILNQAIWDLIVSYDFICANPSISTNNCIYSSFANFINPILSAEACYQLFLLSFSRFLALFFYNFYGWHSTPIKIISAITIYNILFILLVNLSQIYSVFATKGNTLFYVFMALEYILKLMIIIFSFIFIVLILIKIFRQFKFQMQQDRAKTRGSIRIASVLVFNCIIIAIFFAFTSVYEFHFNIFPTFYAIVNNKPPGFKFSASTYMINNIKKNQKCINVIRVLLDSVVVLFVLSEYRKSIFTPFKFFFPPKIANTTVTIASNSRRL